MVGNGQNNGPTTGQAINGGCPTDNTVNSNSHTVISSNDLAQLMSGHTMTGLLNPDGSITLNSGMLPNQQMTSIATTVQGGIQSSITTTSGANYMSRLQSDQMLASPTSSINTLQSINGDSDLSTPANNSSINHQHRTPQIKTEPIQKKTGQKRLTAKQKLAQQQQQQKNQQQLAQQQNDTSHIITTQADHSMSQQAQIVATVQLPNGQIGQLIAPSGGHFWSPNAINLQQLSMAVAAATGTMSQPMSIPTSSPNSQQGHQMGNMQNLQQQSMQSTDHLHQNSQQQQQQQNHQNPQQQAQQNQQQQQSSQSVNNQNQQVMTTIQLPNNQIAQVMGRPAQNQLWSGGSISISQLSALAQQGVVQLSPIQGMPTGPNGHMIPQAAIQGLLNQNGQSLQAIPISSGGQFVTQDPEDPSKWQIVQSSQVTAQQQNVGNSNSNDMLNQVSRESSNFEQFNDSGPTLQNSSETSQSSQPQKKLKRLACTCPNCRDGDNTRSAGDKKKQHICHFPDCNKVYGKTSHLRAHLRWHSGERPYVCNWSFCGKKFTRSDELQRHRRTHTGEKRFQCPECLKRFMRSDHLSKHLKTHLSSKKALHSD